MGSRYTIEIQVVGNAAGQLSSIGKSVGALSIQLRGLEDANKQIKEMNSGLDAMKGFGLTNIGDQAQRAADRLTGLSDTIIGFSTDLTKSIVADASTFEDTQSSLQFAFGDKWEGVFDKVKKEAANLTFTFDEVAGLAASMGRMKINPFGTDGSDLAVFKTKTGAAVSALQILQDVADATGRDTNHLMFSMRNAMAGQFKSLKDAVDMPTEAFTKLTKEMNAAKDPQQKYNILIKQLGEYFGGAGLSKAKNWSKAIAQVPDLLQQLRAGVGAEGIKEMTPAVFSLVDALGRLVKDKDAVGALANGFGVVAKVFVWGTHAAINFIDTLRGALKAAPWLPAFIVGFLLMTAVITGAAGAALGLAATLLVLGGAIATVGWPAFIGALLVSIAVLPIAMFLLGGLATIAVAAGQAMSGSLGTFGDKLVAIKTVFQGLREMFSTYKDGVVSLSTETRKSLEGMGLGGLIGKMARFAITVMTFIDAVKSGFSSLGSALSPEFSKTLDQLWATIQAIGFSLHLWGRGADDTKAWAGAAQWLVNALVTVATWILEGVRAGLRIVEVAANYGILSATVHVVSDAVGLLVTVFRLLGAVAQRTGPIMIFTFAVLAQVMETGMAGVTFIVDKVMWLAEALGLVDKAALKLKGSFAGLNSVTIDAAGGGDGGLRNSMFGGELGYAGIDPRVLAGQSAPGTWGGKAAGAADAMGIQPSDYAMPPPRMGALLPPSHVLPPVNYGGAGAGSDNGSAEVVTAVGGVKEAIAALAAKPSTYTTQVMLDSKVIQEVVNSAEAGKNG